MIAKSPAKKKVRTPKQSARSRQPTRLAGGSVADKRAPSPAGGDADARASAAVAGKPASGRNSQNSQTDRNLIDRCLSGDRVAWERLYDQFHAPLLLAIRIFLGRSGSRHDLVDDIAAKVWFTVIDRQAQMLDRFDSDRGCRLSTFLASIAKNEVLQYFRAERRRNARETQACRGREGADTDSRWNSLSGVNAAVTEFLATLTPREREYCEGYLLALRDIPADGYSNENRWQLNHRVRSKLAAFLKSD